MKKKELRLALVCCGGLSLVLYMQGVIKEFLKLTRASKAYHSIDDPERQQIETFATAAGSDGRERDTEGIYFSLLQAIGKDLDLRIIVDSVAGASAGGISGIILARALAHDLSIDHLRSRWLEETDVLRLLAKSQRARAWSKWFLYPMLWILLRSRMFELVMDREVRRKMSTFLRSRWFETPFDGDRFLELLFDGLRDMGQSDNAPSSLLPPGHVLDLAVSVTDFFGYPRRISINTPAVIQEREQSLLWKFTYCHWTDGREISDFGDDNLPSLALAARATSSFPGAFPPVQLTDIDRLLERRSLKWTSRSQFIRMNFREQIRAGIDPTKTSFVDGSIVNDKPFSAAINAIRERAAYRDVDRRLVYIDPDPGRASPPPDGQVPSFLQTLEAAIFEIPLHAPIHGELARLAQFNELINGMRRAQAKTGRRIGANIFIQGFVTSTFQSYRTWVRSPSGRKVQRPRPSSSPEACPSIMDMGSMRVIRVSKVSWYGKAVFQVIRWMDPSPFASPTFSSSTWLTARHHKGHSSIDVNKGHTRSTGASRRHSVIKLNCFALMSSNPA